MIKIEIDGVSLEVEFDIEPGQVAITHLAPEDCQEGFAPSIDITGIRALSDVFFLLSDDQIERIESMIVKSLSVRA